MERGDATRDGLRLRASEFPSLFYGEVMMAPSKRSEYDPAKHGTYGEWLRSKGIQVRPGGWTWRTRDQVSEYRGKDGHPVKDTVDQLGNRVIQHGRDQQSVQIRAPHVRAIRRVEEVR